ncbi:hypothetical protein F4806DRAFT_445292 [Annulohypoxylon nitens]|nr:hypothetical protein F4806DRAFT_445292 [Annulohypoxylon nitens]
MGNMEDVAVYEINAGDGDGADITFGFNDQQISISIFTSSSAPHDLYSDRKQPFLEDRLIDMLGQAVSTDVNTDEYEKIVDDALDLILDVGKAIFMEVNLPNKTASQPPNQGLQVLLFPTILAFRLKTIGGKAAIIPINPDEGYTYHEANFDPNTETYLGKDDNLPQYLPRQILILETLIQGIGYVISRVLVNNKEMLCKAQGKRPNPDLDEELLSLQKIRRALLHNGASVRVPQILGYVRHPELECTIGFLREWVPGECLNDIHLSEIPKSRRRKWASQIRQTVNQLHEMKVVWGEGKPKNVIIDEEDNAWLINSGGAATEEWIYKQSADTEEGDKQAVEKIAERLGVEGDY